MQRGLERIREAAKLGFRTVMLPTANKPKQGVDDVTLVGVDRIGAALDYLRSGRRVVHVRGSTRNGRRRRLRYCSAMLR